MDNLDPALGVTSALTSLLANRLVLLAGAGLSMAPPSCLPSAWDLARLAKQKYAATYGPLALSLSDKIDDQAEYFYSRNELAAVYLGSLIDPHAFAGRVNDGHLAIADFILTKSIQAVATTNVDCLIEAAGGELYGQVETAIDATTAAAAAAGAVPLLKIHGCRTRDLANTVWAKSQLADEPVKSRVSSSAGLIKTKFANRDLLIVGYWTDWDYLNEVLDEALNTVTPTKCIVVDPADPALFSAKAPSLYALGQKASGGFYHVRQSGSEFLAELRREYSAAFVRKVLHDGADTFTALSGLTPDPNWLEPPPIDNADLWQARRNLSGTRPNSPVEKTMPDAEPLLGATILQLRQAGGVADGANWVVKGKSVRVLRAAIQPLHIVESVFRADMSPAAAADIVVAVGAEDIGLPPSITRPVSTGTITRGPRTSWVTRDELFREIDR